MKLESAEKINTREAGRHLKNKIVILLPHEKAFRNFVLHIIPMPTFVW